MVGHWKFPAGLRNTLLLAAVVVPVQLALALSMASIVTKLTTGRSAILYIFAIPLGLSDLAAGPDLARDPRAVGLPQQLADGARQSSTSR